jgi:hypothetical protein
VALSFAIRQELDYISSYIESILLNTMSWEFYSKKKSNFLTF